MKSQPAMRRKLKGQTVATGTHRKRFSCVIADENPLCRKGLRDLLREDGQFEILADADSAEAAIRAILELKPDVAVLDANLPGFNVLNIAGLLRVRLSRTDLVVFAPQDNERLFNQAMSVGIKGYILKRNSVIEILDCVAAVAGGSAYVSPSFTDFLLHRRHRTDSLRQTEPGLAHLTIAERRILKRIAQGKTSREIAKECSISPRTVESHRAHMCKKLGLSGTNRLLQFALEYRDALGHLD